MELPVTALTQTLQPVCMQQKQAGLNVKEIKIPFDKHHKVSPLVKSRKYDPI